MWTLYSTPVAIFINLILMIFLILFVWNGYDIYSKLHVADHEAVTGKFTNFADAHSNMDELG